MIHDIPINEIFVWQNMTRGSCNLKIKTNKMCSTVPPWGTPNFVRQQKTDPNIAKIFGTRTESTKNVKKLIV
jgi:hypothetical protein